MKEPRGHAVRKPIRTTGESNMFRQWIHNNIWLFFGISIGIFFCSVFSDYSCIYEAEESANLESIFKSVETAEELAKVVPRVQNATRKPKQTKETKKLVRPRYYSTELGMKDKLFVGVLSSEEKIGTQAVHINKTIAHLVDKVKFFITAQQNLKNKYNLSIVGFTDTRHVYRPFQVVKYIGDPFVDEYDYYFLMYDFTYLNARKLKVVADKISVSLNVYMGTPVTDGSYCDLNAGILLSNSVIKAMKENLDWCVRNAVSEDDSENLGRCIHHSTKLTCQEIVQKQTIPGFKLKTFDLEKDLERLLGNPEFRTAITVYSVLQRNDFYLLHTYFSKENLKEVKVKIDEISKDLDVWPPGRKNNAKPATRFDVPQTLYFNMTHVLFPDDFTNVRQHTSVDAKDVQYVVNAIISKVLQEKPDDFQFARLVNGYRTFRLSRGLDYQIDLAFRDLHTGKEVIKRFEVCKQLGDVEFLSKPYTTENTRVIVLLPIQEHEKDEAMYFLDDFIPNVMDVREKVVLMFVFLYQYNTVSKGSDDHFKDLKDLALQTTNKYHSEDTKVAWVSIRLPVLEETKPVRMEDHPVLNFALIDLALRKIGLESLVLVLDVYAEINVEFLNRVKMNTISEFQIFNPIPFRQYNPEISNVETFEVHKDCGHFDREEYKYISFYGKDYVKARKEYSSRLPIVKSDPDISIVLQPEFNRMGNVFEMFILHLPDVHGMRATEAALKVKYHDETYNENRENLFLGTKSQLAKIILEREARMVS